MRLSVRSLSDVENEKDPLGGSRVLRVLGLFSLTQIPFSCVIELAVLSRPIQLGDTQYPCSRANGCTGERDLTVWREDIESGEGCGGLYTR